MICYFRKPVLPIEKELNSSDLSCYKHNDSADVEAMCGKMLRMKKTLFSNAAKNIKRAQTRQKEYYDKQHFRKKVMYQHNSEKKA